jgi:hypothetical protein
MKILERRISDRAWATSGGQIKSYAWRGLAKAKISFLAEFST